MNALDQMIDLLVNTPGGVEAMQEVLNDPEEPMMLKDGYFIPRPVVDSKALEKTLARSKTVPPKQLGTSLKTPSQAVTVKPTLKAVGKKLPMKESINVKEKIRNLKDGEIMIVSVPSGKPTFDKLKIKKNPKYDNIYTLWNVDEEGNISNEVKFSSLNNAAYWASQGDLEGVSLEEATKPSNRYKVSKYSRYWYGILDNQIGLLLRVGPNADYSKPLDKEDNKLLLFHSKDEAQSYIDSRLNSKQDLKESTMNESKKDTVDIYYDDLEITVVTKKGNPSGYYDTSFGNWLPDDDETEEIDIDYEYEADWDDVYDVLWDNVVDEPEMADKSDEEIEKYIKDNFDDLAEKYIDKLRDYFEEDAREEAEEKYADDYLYESTSSNPYIFKELKEAAESDIKLKDFWEDVEQPVEEEEDFEIDTKLPYEGMEDDDPVLDDISYGWNDIDMEAAPEENWEEVASKDVFDADGFLTTYKWFKSVDADGNERHIFMFNEDEADPDYADYECESEAEAREHFNNFKDLDTADNSIDALKEFIPLPEADKEEEIDYDDQLERMHEAALGEDESAKKLREGFMSDFDIDIQEIGGKEAMALKLEKEIAALEAEMSFLTDIAPREVGAGGAFDSRQEIAEAKKATQKELDLKRAKLGLLRG